MECFVLSAPVRSSTIPERRLEPDWWWAKRIRYIRKEVTGPVGNTIGLSEPLFDDEGFREPRGIETPPLPSSAQREGGKRGR